MGVSVLQQAKNQAQVQVPIVKALQAELGKERANALVGKALRDLYRGYGKEFWRKRSDENVGKAITSAFATFARDDVLDYDVKRQSENACDIDVTGCRYADFYRKLGEADLGFLLVCSADHQMAEGFGSQVKLARTQTIMQGASHCDFRYRRSRNPD